MKPFVLCGLLACYAAAWYQAQPEQIARDPKVRLEFLKQTGHPQGWPGHVDDHKIPLCAGGPDAVDNMQWQTKDDAAAKDKFEWALCREMKRQGYHLVKVDAVK